MLPIRTPALLSGRREGATSVGRPAQSPRADESRLQAATQGLGDEPSAARRTSRGRAVTRAGSHEGEQPRRFARTQTPQTPSRKRHDHKGLDRETVAHKTLAPEAVDQQMVGGRGRPGTGSRKASTRRCSSGRSFHVKRRCAAAATRCPQATGWASPRDESRRQEMPLCKVVMPGALLEIFTEPRRWAPFPTVALSFT